MSQPGGQFESEISRVIFATEKAVQAAGQNAYNPDLLADDEATDKLLQDIVLRTGLAEGVLREKYLGEIEVQVALANAALRGQLRTPDEPA